MNKILLAVVVLFSLGSPVFAATFEYQTEPCVTKGEVIESILTKVSDSVVVYEQDTIVVFSAPSEELNFRGDFNSDGCLYLGTYIDDVALELLKQGV